MAILLYGALLALAFGQQVSASPPVCWIVGLVQQKSRAAAQLREKTVFFIGGSATHYGVRAGQFAERTGLPAYNFGTNAGLGLPYLLEEAKAVLKPGDVAVLLPEFILYHGESVDEVFAKVTFCRGSFFPASLPLPKLLAYLRNIGPAHLLEGARRRLLPRPHEESCADTAEVTAQGDVSRYFIESLQPVEFQRSLEQAQQDISLWIDPSGGDPEAHPPARALKDFKAWCDPRGILVLTAYPNVYFDPEWAARPFFRKYLAGIEALYRAIGIPFLGDFASASYPKELFLETHYHLGPPGAARRTEDLARLFCAGTGLCLDPAFPQERTP